MKRRKPSRPKRTPWENFPPKQEQDVHKKLGCIFYALAILYYVIQVVREVGGNIRLPHNTTLSSLLAIDPIVWVSQILIIVLMLKKRK